MEFSEQIKKIRIKYHLNQEDMAKALHVSIQTISSWENDRNLPDLEMVVTISKLYQVSLDQLIIGKNMESKLIKDGSENRRTKMNLVLIVIATILLLIGIICFIIKGLSVEYVDDTGILHENFFLILCGYLLVFAAFITYSCVGITNLIQKLKHRH